MLSQIFAAMRVEPHTAMQKSNQQHTVLLLEVGPCNLGEIEVRVRRMLYMNMLHVMP